MGRESALSFPVGKPDFFFVFLFLFLFLFFSPWYNRHGWLGVSNHLSIFFFLPYCRPDMTFAVDWALNNNCLSILPYYISSYNNLRCHYIESLIHVHNGSDIAVGVSCQFNSFLKVFFSPSSAIIIIGHLHVYMVLVFFRAFKIPTICTPLRFFWISCA